MTTFAKILVPIDFSSHSSEAIRYAADLARRYQGTLTLVHAYQPVAYALPEGFVLYTPAQFANMLTEFEKLLAAAKLEAEQAGASRVETRSLQGDIASEIVDLAKKDGHDLIVMGTHGRTGASHVLLGSIAEKVVRRAPCPVLTVRAIEQKKA
jgi:nucleotide-binding universal stress UspA family protein